MNDTLLKRTNIVLTECLECKELLINKEKLLKTKDSIIAVYKELDNNQDSQRLYLIKYIIKLQDSVTKINLQYNETLKENHKQTVRKRYYRTTTIIAIIFEIIRYKFF